MNDYRINGIREGLAAEFRVTVSRMMMDLFLQISGDNNPMHLDREFAREHGFEDRLVYGMLSSSFYSRLVGVHLPGKYSILHSIEVSFNKPVYMGDQLLVSGVVTHVNEAYRQIEIKAMITNQSGDKVSKAKIKVGIHG